MRRLLIMLALAGSFAHAASARVSPIGTTRKSDPKPLAGRVVEFAEHQVGVRYRFGGISRRTGFDCSGLVYAAYRSIGRMIPHSTWGQMTMGTRVPFGALRPGDLLFTEGGGHVQLVVSNTAAISAPQTGERVRYVPLAQLRTEFAGARRLIR